MYPYGAYAPTSYYRAPNQYHTMRTAGTGKRKIKIPTVRFRTYNKKSRLGYSTSEVKFKDNQLVSSSIGAAWAASNPSTTDCLNGVSQGTSESEHLGRTMFMTSIFIRGQIVLVVSEGQTAPVSDNIIRIVMVLDTDTKGVEVVATEVMDAGQTEDVFAFRNLQHTSRLTVLKDKTMTMRPWTTNEGASNLFAHNTRRMAFTMYKNFKIPIKVLFSGTSAVVGSIVDNSLHIITCASAAGTTINYQCRLRFKDTL